MLELPAGTDLGDDDEPLAQRHKEEGSSEAVAPVHPAGDGGATGIHDDGGSSSSGGGWETDLTGFWARYNQVLLSKVLLKGARDRLEDEHRHLRVGGLTNDVLGIDG